jgi:hypothetical protein
MHLTGLEAVGECVLTTDLRKVSSLSLDTHFISELVTHDTDQMNALI